MRCPFCAHDDSQVKDSRPTEDADVADAAEFFASDLANLISGQYLLLNATSNIHLT